MNIKIKFGIINIVKTWTLIITSLIDFISIIFPVFANEPNLIVISENNIKSTKSYAERRFH